MMHYPRNLEEENITSSDRRRSKRRNLRRRRKGRTKKKESLEKESISLGRGLKESKDIGKCLVTYFRKENLFLLSFRKILKRKNVIIRLKVLTSYIRYRLIIEINRNYGLGTILRVFAIMIS